MQHGTCEPNCRIALVVALFLGVLHPHPLLGEPVSFEEQIRPILNQHCVACHGGVKQAGDLSFVYAEDAADVIEPGAASHSQLIERITASDEEDRMPPAKHGRRLNENEIRLLRTWINEGAEWQAHWAYRMPKRQVVPSVSNSDWCRETLDYFVLERLESRNITPAKSATSSQWLRRASLDLIGLPPTPKEVDAFESELSADPERAYRVEVDRLLASERFGERWATVWFDLVRYADSQGLGQDRNRNVWKYRDWVIRAFNDDLPYDQFTIKQIAGDLLTNPSIDDRLATAVHRLTQTNSEGGTDDEEFRIAAVLDRISTIWQTWQGTTMGCVQCHSHPYDPIRHNEYYEFAAYWNNSVDTDTADEWPTIPVPNDAKESVRAGNLVNEIRALRHRIWKTEHLAAHVEPAWEPVNELKVDANAEMATEQVGPNQQFYLTGNARTGFTMHVEFSPSQFENPITALRLNILPLNPEKARSDSEWGFTVSELSAARTASNNEPQPLQFDRVIGDEPFPRLDPNESINAESDDGFIAYTRIHHTRRAVFVLNEPLALKEGESIRLKIRCHRKNPVNHPMIIKRGYIELTTQPEFVQKFQSEGLADQRSELADLESALQKIDATLTPIMDERPPHLRRPTHVFRRGLYLTKGQEVKPDVPKFLKLKKQPPIENRLELAEFMVSKNNPLTARVAVNRFWSRIFGTGLVATEEDFGSTGERPSHPELLDDLSVRFQNEMGWSVKKLLREIVLSSTYRQSAALRPDVKDPANRLLARGPRMTLPAEMVRDHALAISGLLSNRMYGPPAHPPIPKRVWTPFEGQEKWETPPRGDENRYRRSVYTQVKRTIPYPMHAAFDAPTREYCTPRRLRSNTPLQPLITLNDEVFVECAEGLAERMSEFDGSSRQKISYGFKRATCREPNRQELERLLLLRAEADDEEIGDSWKTIATVLLNLDEVLNK